MKLILTEKQDQAKKIADAMDWRKGTHCFTGRLEGVDAVVVWARGHLFALKTPDDVSPDLGWNEPERLTPIDQSFKRKPSVAAKFIAPIKSHLKQAHELIIATDSDREGEAIGWEIAEELRFSGPVRRLWLAAGLDKKSIREAMGHLRSPDITKSWYRASEARNRADWAYMLAVRSYTHFASYGKFGEYLGRGASAKERVMSVGRVQTPALGMIVKRDWLIENFVSRDHFKVAGFFSTPAGDVRAQYTPMVSRATIEAQPIGVEWEASKAMAKEGEPDPLEVPLFTDKSQVDAFVARLRAQADVAMVSAFKASTRKENPPKTFSLSDAQVAMGKVIGLSASTVQTVLEDLYEQGWISYARTSKSDLPKNLYAPEERNALLAAMMGLEAVSAQALHAANIHNGKLAEIKPFLPSVFTDKNLEHHGIVPTSQVMSAARFSELKPRKGKGYSAQKMQQAYLMVARQFIQALYPAAQYHVQQARFIVPCVDLLGNDVSLFYAKGERLFFAGWRSAFQTCAEKDTSLPVLCGGDKAPLREVIVDAVKTAPPKRYTEANFPKAMENVGRDVSDATLRRRLKDSEGIGTPATRKTIVETLLSRGYIQTKQGSYYSTEKGRELIGCVPNWLASAETTALWEDCLVKICEQRDDGTAMHLRDQFVVKSTQRIEALIISMVQEHQGSLGAKVTRSTPYHRSSRPSASGKGRFADKKNGVAASGLSPTERQVSFAESLIKKATKDFVVPIDWRHSRKVCSQLISQLSGQ